MEVDSPTCGDLSKGTKGDLMVSASHSSKVSSWSPHQSTCRPLTHGDIIIAPCLLKTRALS